MITARELKMLTTYDDAGLALTLEQDKKHKDVLFETAKFAGITNGGEFAYDVTYLDGNTVRKDKVFLEFDTVSKRVTASY
jgi:hypothetical protein